MATTFTNIHNLPDAFVNAVKVDRHRVHGNISTTQLIDAPQVRYLRKKFGTNEDVSDRYFMLLGTAFHTILENSEIANTEARVLTQAKAILEFHGNVKGAASMDRIIRDKYAESINDDVLLERTMTCEVDDWTISGTVDRAIISTKTIQDYKSTSVYAFMNPEARKKYVPQLNIYAYMLEQQGIIIENLEVVFIFRDWSKGKATPGSNYPPAPIVTVSIPRRTNEQIEDYMKKRVALHKLQESGTSVACSPKERWSEPNQYAVTKKGGKRAMKKFTVEEEAEKFIKFNNHKYLKTGGLYIDTRIGGSRRCADFCAVASSCPQRKAELYDMQNNEL